ncbi:MAG: helix-turn-helix domain-containing protein [Hyphomicrobiales bacterium]
MTNQTIHSDVGLDLSLLLTVEEAAILLRLGRTQTYELVMRGKVPSVKIGRRRLVVREGLRTYVSTLLEEQALSY